MSLGEISLETFTFRCVFHSCQPQTWFCVVNVRVGVVVRVSRAAACVGRSAQ